MSIKKINKSVRRDMAATALFWRMLFFIRRCVDLVGPRVGRRENINSLTEVQREQSTAQAQLQSILNAASEFAIIATSLDGTINVFSPGAERMLGYRAREIVGKANPMLFHIPEEVSAEKSTLELQLGRALRNDIEFFAEQIRDDRAFVHEWSYRRKDGSCLPVRLIVTAMRDEQCAVNGYLCIAKDISQQRSLQTSLVKAKEQAEAASHAKSEFVANMSHEIRTPLNAVLGMAHLLGTTPLSNDQRDYLEMIRVSGSSLLGIINDILDFSKIEAGRMEIVPEPFDLNGVLGAVANIMMVNAGEKDLELALGVAPDVPLQLIGDALHLQQVLTNLVSNAIKFTASGEVSLLVESDPVTADNTVTLRFLVRDTGIGMDQQQQEKIFSAFSQADSSTTRRFGGTGLGLAICKRLVALMQGSIQLRSAPGVGSEFSVILPMRCVPGVASPLETGHKKMRVLVVDDNATSRDYLCKTIRGLHWLVDGAATGAHGIALAVSKQDEPYDLILIDWQMPDMDSFILMQTLRASLKPTVPPLHISIMVSAFGRGKLIGAQNVVMADSILVKPVTADNLLIMTQHGSVNMRRVGERATPFELLHRKWDHRIDGIRILLVEDNHLNQVVARGMLVQAGASVDVLDDGLKAVERMAGATNYDMILMDVQMPVMDGCTAARRIREELKLSIPILAMTAGVLVSEREQCIASGMSAVIAKPIDVEQMFTTILRFLPKPDLDRPAAPMVREITPSTPEPMPGLVFNPDPVLKVGKDDPAYRKRMLDLIRNTVLQSPSQFAEAKMAWEEGKMKDAAKILHGMRSALGMLGARQFSAATVAIEKALHEEDFGTAPALFEFAEISLDTTMRQASVWLENHVE